MKKEWISVYLYHNISFEDVILGLLNPLIDNLYKKGYIKSYFFIRYWEGGPHIRFRILTDRTKSSIEIKNYMQTFSCAYFNSLKIDNTFHIEFNQYERELQRYGGNDGIIISENFFHDSSKITIKILRHYYNFWNYSLAISFALQMHIIFAKEFFANAEESSMFFKKIHENWLYYSLKKDKDNQTTIEEINKINNYFNKSYILQKEKVKKILYTIYCNDNIDIHFNKVWIDYWALSCKKASEKISKNANLYTNSEMMLILYDSYIHMTNNRLGIYLRDESYIAFILFKAFEELISENT